MRRITGELAGIAEAAMREAVTVIRNARRALRGAIGQRKGRLHRAINDPHTLVGRTERVVAQTRSRLAGVMPESASRVVSLHDVEARPIRKGRLGKPVEFGYKAQLVDNVDGVILDHHVEMGNPPDAPQLAPAITRIADRAGRTPRAVTADRGYGEASVERDLHDLGVCSVAIPRKSKPTAARRELEHRRAFREKNGAPGAKDGSTTSSAATAGTAPNSPASTEPEPGADTASSPTTSSRSAPWQHETDNRELRVAPTAAPPAAITAIKGFSGRSSYTTSYATLAAPRRCWRRRRTFHLQGRVVRPRWRALLVLKPSGFTGSLQGTGPKINGERRLPR